jgi:hypothetical protein
MPRVVDICARQRIPREAHVVNASSDRHLPMSADRSAFQRADMLLDDVADRLLGLARADDISRSRRGQEPASLIPISCDAARELLRTLTIP